MYKSNDKDAVSGYYPPELQHHAVLAACNLSTKLPVSQAACALLLNAAALLPVRHLCMVCCLQMLREGDFPAAAAQEVLEVFAPLADQLGVWSLKAELEDLAFQVREVPVDSLCSLVRLLFTSLQSSRLNTPELCLHTVKHSVLQAQA